MTETHRNSELNEVLKITEEKTEMQRSYATVPKVTQLGNR